MVVVQRSEVCPVGFQGPPPPCEDNFDPQKLINGMENDCGRNAHIICHSLLVTNIFMVCEYEYMPTYPHLNLRSSTAPAPQPPLQSNVDKGTHM